MSALEDAPFPSQEGHPQVSTRHFMFEYDRAKLVDLMMARFGVGAVIERIDDVGRIAHSLAKLERESARDYLDKGKDLDELVVNLPDRVRDLGEASLDLEQDIWLRNDFLYGYELGHAIGREEGREEIERLHGDW
jgi:hypothetical protein